MRECTTKSILIRALYHYMTRSDTEEKVDCLNQFACDPYRSVSIYTDHDELDKMFEMIIEDCITDLDEGRL